MEHLTLLALTRIIKRQVEQALQPSYWVVAEIGEVRSRPGGHCYLDLLQKEEERLVAKLKANIWASTYEQLIPWFQKETGQTLKEGMKILANVSVQYHEIFGLSLVVNDIDANFTLGERERQKQQVIAKLKSTGVYDKNRQLPFPLVAQRIAVISSASAAGWQDFRDQLTNNPYGYYFKVKLFPALLQGDAAVQSIIEAFTLLKEELDEYDAVVIVRGGGAQLDFDTFNAYRVCATIARCPLPILTGIGHDRDQTIADMVAHQRLKTPTAVAEFLINRAQNFEETINRRFQRIVELSNNLLKTSHLNLVNKESLLKLTLHQQLNGQRNYLTQLQHDLSRSTQHQIQAMDAQLKLIERSTQLLDPHTLFKKGYTISMVDGTLLKNLERVKAGQRLTTYGESVIIESSIEQVNESTNQ